MKRGQENELRQERDRDIYDVYLSGIRSHQFQNIHEAADWARLQSAPRHYVSSKALVNYIGAKMHGKNPPHMYAQNKRRMNHLYQKYLDFLKANPKTKLSRDIICEQIIDSPAPEFFICIECAVKAILKERDRRKEEMIKRLSL